MSSKTRILKWPVQKKSSLFDNYSDQNNTEDMPSEGRKSSLVVAKIPDFLIKSKNRKFSQDFQKKGLHEEYKVSASVSSSISICRIKNTKTHWQISSQKIAGDLRVVVKCFSDYYAYMNEVATFKKLSKAYSQKNSRPVTDRHSLIVRFLENWSDETNHYISLEYMSGGSLENLLQPYSNRGENVTPRHVAFYLAEVSEALLFLHENGILHSDIQPNNVLIKGNGHICLSDFDNAISDVTSSGKRVVIEGELESTAHIAPELRRTIKVGSSKNLDQLDIGNSTLATWASDWFSLGHMAYYIYHQTGPYKQANNLEELEEFYCIQPSFTKVRGPQADLIRQLISIDPLQRPKGEEVIRHWGIIYYLPDLRHINGMYSNKATAVSKIRSWIRCEKLTPPLRI